MKRNKVYRVTAAQDAAIRAFADKRGIGVTEAVDRLLSKALGRQAALDKYALKPRPAARKKRAAKKAPRKRAKLSTSNSATALGHE